MSTTLKNIKIPYPTEGVIRSAQLYDTVAPENSVQLAVNLHFDTIGAMTTRLGVSSYVVPVANVPITALGTLNVLNGGKWIFAQQGTTINASNNGGAFFSVRLATTTNRARFAQYLNVTYMVNGVDALQASTGGAFSVIAGLVPANPMPATSRFISAGFGGRLWLADPVADVLYYSDVVQFVAPSSYIITYPVPTPTSGNFVSNLFPQNGQSITGLFQVPRALLVFKQNTIIRVYSTENVDPFPAYNVGTYSQESIVQAKDGVYFHHSSGFYKFVLDGQPIEISRRVIDFVKAISRSNYENVRGIYDGYDAIEWHVGSVTLESATYVNCVMRYSISTQTWTVYDYGETNITAMIRFDNGTVIRSICGTSDGALGWMDNGYTDFSKAIRWEMIDRWRSYTEMWSKSKNISGIMVQSLNGGGSILQYQHQKSAMNEWEYIDTLSEDYDSLFPNASTDDFSVARLRLTGSSTGSPVVLTGVELLSVQDKGFEEN